MFRIREANGGALMVPPWVGKQDAAAMDLRLFRLARPQCGFKRKLPRIEVAMNSGLNASELKTAARKIKEHEHEIKEAWAKHFG